MSDLFRPRMALAGLRTANALYVGEGSSVVLRSLDAARVLVVMSRSVGAGEAGQRLVERVRASDVRVVSPSWEGEPTLTGVSGLVADIEGFSPDVIVAVGGGSVMDGTKVARLLAEQPDTVVSVADDQASVLVRAYVPLARLVAIPTTAGTGSEVSSAAVIGIGSRKVPVVSSGLIADAVVLDPMLLVGAPRTVAYASLLDAISHAVEGYVSTVRNPLMDSCAESVIRDVHRFAADAFDDNEMYAFERVQIAALMAGWVQNQSLVGACHAVAHSLGHRFGHGEANAMVLPHVIRLNASLSEDTAQRYAQLTRTAGVGDDADSLAVWVEQLRVHAGLPSAVGIDDHDDLIRRVVGDVAARTNPVSVDEGYARALVSSLVAEHHAV